MISPQYHLPELRGRQGRLCRIIVRIKGKIRKKIPGVCLTEEEFMKRMWDVEV
jgi:hypothetical protein